METFCVCVCVGGCIQCVRCVDVGVRCVGCMPVFAAAAVDYEIMMMTMMMMIMMLMMMT